MLFESVLPVVWSFCNTRFTLSTSVTWTWRKCNSSTSWTASNGLRSRNATRQVSDSSRASIIPRCHTGPTTSNHKHLNSLSWRQLNTWERRPKAVQASDYRRPFRKTHCKWGTAWTVWLFLSPKSTGSNLNRHPMQSPRATQETILDRAW